MHYRKLQKSYTLHQDAWLTRDAYLNGCGYGAEGTLEGCGWWEGLGTSSWAEHEHCDTVHTLDVLVVVVAETHQGPRTWTNRSYRLLSEVRHP